MSHAALRDVPCPVCAVEMAWDATPVEPCDECIRADRNRLAEENATLKAALREYGNHDELCKCRSDAKPPRCDCGFDALLAAREAAP